jgi:hypothetical protein
MLMIAIGACTSSNDDAVDQRRCTQLRDHLIDLRLKGLEDVDIASHRRALTQALGDEFVASCQQSIAWGELKCMLDAADQETAESCRHAAVATKP